MQSLSNAADREIILKRIAALQSTSPRKWGRMNVNQMICHLNDSFKVGLGERAASSATGFAHRTLVKWIALWLPIPWPKGLPTRPEIEQGVGGTPPAEFERDRTEMLKLIERFCEFRDAPKRPRVHPIFGELREDEWLRWGYLHADHHLRQFGA
jgi:Protein of unknown function (DUF1569)